MKQKYMITKNDAKDELIIREFAELDKDTFSPLCEETFNIKMIKEAITQGKAALLAAIRTKNFFPPGVYTEQIALSILNLINSDETSAEMVFDDSILLARDRQELEEMLDISPDADTLDDLLEEDYSDSFEEKEKIKKMGSSIKVADDEYMDVDDDA